MTRGRKPKPKHLRVVDGTYRADRHGLRPDPAAFVPLVKPKVLSRRASAAWDKFIAPATWLDQYRGAAALAFVELWVEFQEFPRQFSAARHAQMRAYAAVLGLSDERNRPAPPRAPDEFFQD